MRLTVSAPEPRADAKPLSTWTKAAYGFGAAAYGVKNNGFDYFLMIFYGQVLGVDTRLIGLALLLSLVFDAISDPLVGYISDNWRSKWGRRHPFMYAAAVPVAASYFLLWNPPALSETGLFLFVLVLSIFIRTLITFYETPSSALTAELSQQYDERTSLQSFRLFFAWVVGNLLTVLMFAFLLLPTPEYTDGILNRDGYATYGIIASSLMFLSIMVCALGTHSRIPHLAAPPPPRKITVGRLFKEIFETLSEKSFVALFLAALFGAIATGVAAALAFYMLAYFWEFTPAQRLIWVALVFVSALIGFILAPIMSRWLGKKKAVIALGIVAFSMAPAPVLLRLAGLLPENGDPILFPLLATINVIDIGLIVALQALFASMIADLVEQSEIKTGRRSEGVFFAAVTFIRKSTQGVGAFVAGFVIAFAALPENAVPGQVPEDALWRLGIAYAPTLLVLWTCMIIAVSFYKIDKQGHEENLRTLDRLRAEAQNSPVGRPLS